MLRWLTQWVTVEGKLLVSLLMRIGKRVHYYSRSFDIVDLGIKQV